MSPYGRSLFDDDDASRPGRLDLFAPSIAKNTTTLRLPPLGTHPYGSRSLPVLGTIHSLWLGQPSLRGGAGLVVVGITLRLVDLTL